MHAHWTGSCTIPKPHRQPEHQPNCQRERHQHPKCHGQSERHSQQQHQPHGDPIPVAHHHATPNADFYPYFYSYDTKANVHPERLHQQPRRLRLP